MVTLITLIALLWMPQHYATGDSLLTNQAQDQARHYIEQISKSQRTDLHLWALSTLCQLKDHPEVIKLINSQTSSSDLFKNSGNPFCGSQSHSLQLAQLAKEFSSPNLLLAGILQEENPGKRKQMYDTYSKDIDKPLFFSEVPMDTLFSHIMNQKEMGPAVLPVKRFTFTHFLLLTNKTLRQEDIITTNYLQNAVNSWLTSEISFNRPSLIHSVYLFTLFKGLYYTQQFSKTANLYSDLTGDKLFPISEERMTIYRFLDYTMYSLGFYDRSLEISRNYSIPLTIFFNDKEKELSSLIMQGAYLLKIGKIKEAQKVNLLVQEQVEKFDVDIPKSSLYTNLSITYLKSGNFDKYLDLQYKALDLANRQNNYNHQLKILRNLHVVYRGNDDQSSALRYIEEALELAKKHGRTKDLGSIYTSMGVFYRDLKSSPDSAAIYFAKADSMIDQDQDFNLHIDLLSERAKLLEDRHQYAKALDIYIKTQQYVLSQEDTQSYLDALIDEGRMQMKLGRITKVERIVDELQNSDLSLLNFSDIVKANTLEAKHLIHTNQAERAYQILKPTITQVFERARNSTDIQSGYWNVEPEYLNAIQLYVDLMIDTNRPQKAVLALDQLKTINDAELYQDPMVKSSRLNESELTHYQRLTNQLDQLRKQQLSASGDQRLELQSRIDRLNAQKRALDRKITTYADQQTLGNIQQVQRRLTPKDLVFHITELKNTYYLAQITKRDIRFRTISLGTSTRALFEDAIEEVASGKTDLNKLYRVGQMLDISQLPPQVENIIMIPDSYLFQLPLDIIPVTPPSKNYSYGGTHYLIEQYRTEYLTSLTELVANPRTEKSFKWDYVGFGITEFSNSQRQQLMPLPYASREVTLIGNELQNMGQQRTMLNENSTEKAFREMAPNARLLHLATHSKVYEKDPLFSTIYMSSPAQATPIEQFENQIFAYELFEMNLANELIMLNSCESGSGSYLQGAGIVGISRALRYAGAESLVLNLWSVNDMMASDFAVQFYKALNAGDTKSEALRQAKVHFLKQKNANPHYWGPYMMIGSNRPVVEPHRSANMLLASSFMAYLLVMMGLSYLVQHRRKEH